MPMPSLPPDLSAAEFDALQEDLVRWRPMVEPLAARHALPGEALQALDAGSVMVVLIGRRAVFKLYPPQQRLLWAFERATLHLLHATGQFDGQVQVPVPTPVLLDSGEEQGWPRLVMSQLRGQVLTPHWPALAEDQRCAVLHHIGQVMAAVHALPPAAVQGLAPLALQGGDWSAWIAQQRAGCHARQQRTGLPAHLLAQVDPFIAGPVPMPERQHGVLLTGEYTPMNLLIDPAQPHKLSGMFDFGDGLLGAREMDWLGPLVFMAAGHPKRVQALLTGYGLTTEKIEQHDEQSGWRLPALRLMLLHRYSNLKAQLALPQWRQASSFEELAAWLWPADDSRSTHTH